MSAAKNNAQLTGADMVLGPVFCVALLSQMRIGSAREGRPSRQGSTGCARTEYWRTSASSKGWHVEWEAVPPG
jgi:hypothetical protein